MTDLLKALVNAAEELRTKPFQNVNGITYVPQTCYDQHIAKFGKAEVDKYYAPNPTLPMTADDRRKGYTL